MTKDQLEKLKEVIELGEIVRTSSSPGTLWGKDHTEIWALDGQYYRLKYNDAWVEGRFSHFSVFERVVPVEETVYTRVPFG